MFAFDHKQKKYKYYGEDNTIQYKQRIMKLWFSVLHLLNTNESIANTLKWNNNIYKYYCAFMINYVVWHNVADTDKTDKYMLQFVLISNFYCFLDEEETYEAFHYS